MAIVLAVAPALASAADAGSAAPRTFRHLTWHVDVGVVHRSERERSTALPSADDASGASSLHVGGGTDAHSAGGTAAVDVSIDIVGALPDEGLAAIVSEKGDRTIPPLRLDILRDGTIVVPPADRAKLTAEEAQIAELCARALLTGRPLTVGESWSKSGGDANVKTRATYRIKDYSADGIVLVELDQTLRGSVQGAINQHTYGTFQYDARRTVPVAARVSRVTQSGQLGALDTTEESFEYKLTEDTLPKTGSSPRSTLPQV